MQTFITSVITQWARGAGLPKESVMEQAKDNITLARPRMELQFLPERLTRTGKTLRIARKGTERTRTREMYEMQQDVAVNLLADNRAWLENYCHDFVQLLPQGVVDARGNWVKVRAEKATFSKDVDNRVGTAVIAAFIKVSRLYVLSFTWRITKDEVRQLIPTFTFTIKE